VCTTYKEDLKMGRRSVKGEEILRRRNRTVEKEREKTIPIWRKGEERRGLMENKREKGRERKGK
jgi:hypothetical protein